MQDIQEEDDSRTATVGRKRQRDQEAVSNAPSSLPRSQDSSPKRPRLDDSSDALSPLSEPHDAPSPYSHLVLERTTSPPGETLAQDSFPHMSSDLQSVAKSAELSNAQASSDAARAAAAAEMPSGWTTVNAPSSGSNEQVAQAAEVPASFEENEDFVAFGDIGESGNEEDPSKSPSDDDRSEGEVEEDSMEFRIAASQPSAQPIVPASSGAGSALTESQKSRVLEYALKDATIIFGKKLLDLYPGKKAKSGHVTLVRIQIPQSSGKKKVYNIIPKQTVRKTFYQWVGEYASDGLIGFFEDTSSEHSPELYVVMLYETLEHISTLHNRVAVQPPIFAITEKGKSRGVDVEMSVVGANAASKVQFKNHSKPSGIVKHSIRAFATGKVQLVDRLVGTGELRIDEYIGHQKSKDKNSKEEIKPKDEKKSKAKKEKMQESPVSKQADEGNTASNVAKEQAPNEPSETTAPAGEHQNAQAASSSLVQEVVDLGSGEEGEIAQDSPHVEPPAQVPAAAPAIARTQLTQLLSEERKLQTRYFGAFKDKDLVHCLTCGLAGHMAEVCSSRICQHCQEVDQHVSAACPTMQKCTKCRERGHTKASCPSKLARSNADGFFCDWCKESGHIEEECSFLWRTFIPENVADLKKVQRLIVSCYECGSDRHWGDDCPMRNRRMHIKADTFSAKQANKYLVDPQAAAQERKTGGISIKGRAQSNVISLDSDDDDEGDISAFYGRKERTNVPVRGSIRINTSGRGGDSYRSQPQGNTAPPLGRYETRGPRARSRSPVSRSSGDRYRQRDDNGDRYTPTNRGWQPPLPNEPLPPPPPPQRGGYGGGRGGRGRGRGGNGGASGRGGRGGRGRGR